MVMFVVELNTSDEKVTEGNDLSVNVEKDGND